MDDQALYVRMLAGLRSFCRLVARGSPGSSVVELDGVTVCISPRAEAGSAANSVVYDRPESLAAALDRAQTAYEKAGVEAWRVWVPERDRSSRRLLDGSGYQLRGTRIAMGSEIESFGERSPPPFEIAVDGTIDEVALVNDRAYRYDGRFARTLAGVPARAARLYVIREARAPVACLMALDEAGDCGLYLVATVPEAQGQGLATTLTQHALVEARARGCTTTTLQANESSESFYLRLGYQRLDTLELWQRAH